MGQERKGPIYGNSQVFSPDGELMFRCLEKRAKWYLERDLATIINDNPLSIKLNFIPKGKGESIDILKTERKNKCVVCGIEDLNILTRHHLVPFIYRQHFPDIRKKHSCVFVVPVCVDCHYKYENDYAILLKKELANSYSASLNPVQDTKRTKSLGIVKSPANLKVRGFYRINLKH